MDMGMIYLICIYLIGLCAVRLLTYVNFNNTKILTVAVHAVSFGALYLGVRTYKKNEEEGIEDWFNLTIMLMLGVVCGVPLPFVIGLMRMAKNLILGYVMREEWLKVKEEKRKEREAKGVRRRRSWGLAISALMSIGGGGLFRSFDQTWMCEDWFGPHHWFQAHAVWHAMCAMAVLFVYLFLRSEVFNMYGYMGGYEGGYDWAERERRSSSGENTMMELTMIERRSSREGVGEIL